jgi:hypothetical protein
MKINKTPLFILGLLIVGVGSFSTLTSGCKKDKEVITNTIKDTVCPFQVCPIRGTYVGTSTATGGGSSTTIYTFEDNNLAVGKLTVGGPGVTFGGYRNTCDSMIISVYYAGNSSYYLLKGKFSNNRNTITGTFNNLTTTSDFGTFTITK